MKQYLYGASIQGIQHFIFQTNELQDIIGASELVESICTEFFKQLLKQLKHEWKPENQIRAAAGHIRYIFDDKLACENFVLQFPQKVMQLAPGITISQAVTEFETDFYQAIDMLEKKLQQQKNKRPVSLTTGMLGITRSSNTGLPLIHDEHNSQKDASTLAKRNHNETVKLCQKCFGDNDETSEEYTLRKRIAFNISDLTDKNDWIAVIHADGNGLGEIVREIGKDFKRIKIFSEELNQATIKAANDAFKAIIPQGSFQGKIPIRPIVLGGDDITIIIRGDLAIGYIEKFMHSFEYHTQQLDLEGIQCKHLTICAGIAFIKSSYPFYYGYALAEDLCRTAKEQSKTHASEKSLSMTPSCLMFHKVHDSFIMNYKDISQRGLTTKGNQSFLFGPYYLNENNMPEDHFTIDKLRTLSKALEKKNEIKTSLRQWLTLMFEDTEKAKQHLKRLVTIHKQDKKLIDELTFKRSSKEESYPTLDVLAINTIMNQQTKNRNNEYGND